MVLSNRKLKQKLRLELAKRSQQPQIASLGLPSARLGASKREKRRQQKQSIVSAPPLLLSEREISPPKQHSEAPHSEGLPTDAPLHGSLVSPGPDSQEATCMADDSEMERYRHCMQKVLDKFGEYQNPAGTEKEQADGIIVGFNAQSLISSKKSKPKKNKRTFDIEDTEREFKLPATGKLSKKTKEKISYAEINQDPQDSIHMSNGMRQDTEETERKSEKDVLSTEKAGRKSVSMKSAKKYDQKREADKVQEKLAQAQSSETAANQGLTDLKKVYVGGIPYYCSEDDIRVFFRECGSISEMDFKTFPDSGKFRGIALISFKTEAAAQRAIALDGADMGGRFIKVQPCVSNPQGTLQKTVYSEPPPKADGYTTAYVGNLSWNITEDELRGFFKDCKINAIRFALDKSSGVFKGYGHIDFADDQSLELALQFDQQALLGRPIKIAYAVPRRDGRDQEKNGKPLKVKKG